MKNKLSKLIVAGLVMIGSNAHAVGAQVGSMTVNATVVSGCILSTGAVLDFGSYDPSILKNGDTGSSLIVTCTVGTTFILWSTLAPTSRKMLGTPPANVLNYTLYSDSARTTELPIATGATAITGAGTGLPVAVLIYGTIAAGQAVPAGSYSGSVILNMSY